MTKCIYCGYVYDENQDQFIGHIVCLDCHGSKLDDAVLWMRDLMKCVEPQPITAAPTPPAEWRPPSRDTTGNPLPDRGITISCSEPQSIADLPRRKPTATLIEPEEAT